MEVGIRGVRDEDLTLLLPIWRAAVEASHGFLTSEDVDWYEKLVAGYLPHRGDLRVAVDADDAPLGFIAQDAGEVHMLFVSPGARSVECPARACRAGSTGSPVPIACR